jgi:cell division protease FtsH
MVTQYGMSERFGPMGLESVQGRYLDGRSLKNCSPQTEALIDDEVRDILAACQARATEHLEASGAALDRIADYLLERENISGEEFMRLLKGGEEAAGEVSNLA